MATKVNGIKKITNLTAASTINDADVFMIETTSGSRKVTGATLKTIINDFAQTKADAAAALIADEFDANNSYAAGDYVIQGGKLYRFTADHATGAFDGSDAVEVTVADEMVSDVKINGTSIVDANRDADIPIAKKGTTAVRKYGVVSADTPDVSGINISDSGLISVYKANESDTKQGVQTTRPITPSNQHQSVFYGLSKAAGVNLQYESVTTGTYPDTAKVAIQKMLGAVGANDIAYIENSPIAQHSYVQGEYFVDADGILSKATAAINIDASLDLGTNYTHVNENGGFANDMLAPATLVGSKTLTGDDVPSGAGIISVPLSKPCRHLVVMVKNNGSVLPSWSYLRLNNKQSSPCLQVRASGNNQVYAYCVIDLVNKYGLTLLKSSVDTYANTIAGTFCGDNNNLLNTNVATEIGFSANGGYVEGFEIKIYGR